MLCFFPGRALPLRSHGSCPGFSLIEVLVTLLLISLSLLALLALQNHAQRLSQSARWRAQAVALAADLAERMAANRAASLAGSYAFVCSRIAPPAANACSASAPCAPAALAFHDLMEWSEALATSLPQAGCAVLHRRDGSSSHYTIRIEWRDREAQAAGKSTSSQGVPEALVQRYQAERSVLD